MNFKELLLLPKIKRCVKAFNERQRLRNIEFEKQDKINRDFNYNKRYDI